MPSDFSIEDFHEIRGHRPSLNDEPPARSGKVFQQLKDCVVSVKARVESLFVTVRDHENRLDGIREHNSNAIQDHENRLTALENDLLRLNSPERPGATVRKRARKLASGRPAASIDDIVVCASLPSKLGFANATLEKKCQDRVRTFLREDWQYRNGCSGYIRNAGGRWAIAAAGWDDFFEDLTSEISFRLEDGKIFVNSKDL